MDVMFEELYEREEPIDTLLCLDFEDGQRCLIARSEGFSLGPKTLFVNGQIVMVKP